MDFRIAEEKENKILGRREINFEVCEAKNTPSRKEIRKRIAALKNSKEELVSVVRIQQSYGEHRATGLAFVYKDAKTLKQTEPGYLTKRGTKEKKKETEGKEKEDKGTGEKEKTPEKKE